MQHMIPADIFDPRRTVPTGPVPVPRSIVWESGETSALYIAFRTSGPSLEYGSLDALESAGVPFILGANFPAFDRYAR